MVSPLDCYQQRCGEPWIWSRNASLSPQFEAVFARRYQQLVQERQGKCPVILLAEQAPAAFLASFLAACVAQCPVFLANPNWAAGEWNAALALVQPDLIWRDGTTVSSPEPTVAGQRVASEPGWIMIPTGGSSGQLRFAIHTWETLSASVAGFCQHFDLHQINACCTLPLYHVSGLMQFMRCLRSGGQLVIQPWRSLADNAPDLPQPSFLSLVPAQLQQLLASPAAIATLKHFYAILLGGAPAWPALLAQGRSLQLPLAPTYGMTETASQVATLKPADFLAGKTGCGTPLPHAQIDIVGSDDSATRSPLTPPSGQIKITARSLYLGYYPQARRPAYLLTDDVGSLPPQGLHILGRQSDKIISGGENIFPAEVEAAIRTAGLVTDVAVVGVSDAYWSETPVALYVTASGTPLEPKALSHSLTPHLSRYKHPSRWVWVKHLPRNPQGKLDRAALKAIAAGATGQASGLEPISSGSLQR